PRPLFGYGCRPKDPSKAPARDESVGHAVFPALAPAGWKPCLPATPKVAPFLPWSCLRNNRESEALDISAANIEFLGPGSVAGHATRFPGSIPLCESTRLGAHGGAVWQRRFSLLK